MERLYKYQGMISSLTCKGDKATAIELYDMYDESKAPTRLEVYGGLAKYIYEINCTDAEERYLTANYFFDSNLCLHRIEIPSSDKLVPAKVITSANHLSEKLVIFGPQNYIENPSRSVTGNSAINAGKLKKRKKRPIRSSHMSRRNGGKGSIFPPISRVRLFWDIGAGKDMYRRW